MQNIRSKGTKPERVFAKALLQRKVYFSQHPKSIEGKPDFVFRRKKIVVFVDSDFWHGHPESYVRPKTNTEYWDNKVNRNRERDKKVNRILRDQGWKVIRVWEYDIKNNFEKVFTKLLKQLNKN